jgi:F1F0 ATPase subunit 2
MNESIYMILAVLAGATLGILFYGGLWLTVKKGINAKSGGILFVLSFFLRTGITLVGFYFVSAGSWERMLACLGGFIAARFIITPFLKRSSNTQKEVTI